MKEHEQERPVERTEPASQTGKKSDSSQERLRRNILHLVAGAYLLYLTYRLGSRFVTEIGTIGWNGDMILSLVGAVVFLLTGGFLLVTCILRIRREHTQDKNAPSEER